jgi:hypothetical protein
LRISAQSTSFSGPNSIPKAEAWSIPEKLDSREYFYRLIFFQKYIKIPKIPGKREAVEEWTKRNLTTTSAPGSSIEMWVFIFYFVFYIWKIKLKINKNKI